VPAGHRLVIEATAQGSLVRLAQGAAPASSAADAVLADRMNLILLNSGVLDTTGPVAQQRAQRSFGPAGGKGMALVQFAGPIRPEWYAALQASGVKRVEHAHHRGAGLHQRHLVVERAAHLEHQLGAVRARSVGDPGGFERGLALGGALDGL